MKHFLSLSINFLLFFMCATGQDLRPEVKEAARRYVDAFLRQDYATTVSMMNADYVQSQGGRDSLIRSLQNQDQANAKQNVSIKSIVFFDPQPLTKLGSKLYGVLPDSMVFSMMGAVAYLKSCLIASSTDFGKTWSFMPGASFDWLKKSFPETTALNVTPTSQPQLLELNPGQMFHQTDSVPKNGNTRSLQLIGRRRLALVVVTHGEEYVADTSSIKMVKEKWKKTTLEGAFVPEPENTGKYGQDAANGVIRFVIDDKKYPQAYDKIKAKLKYAGPADKERLKSVFGLED